MPNFLVRKVAVLGAGVMGAQIAAHCVNARVPVVLFDLAAKDGPKNGIALKAIERLRQLSPAPLGLPDLAGQIEAANYDDDLGKLSQCDLIIEAIAERMDWKHGLYEKVLPFVPPRAIFATNTSGLSITELSKGMGPALLPRFCGVHFFNPPRYMHLVELIPTAHTEPAVLDDLEAFLATTLGKGVVRAKDTPNFIGNRVGIFGIVSTMIEAEKAGLACDLVDDLTGAKLERARSGTYRTGDVVGLDTLAHVIETMEDYLPGDPFAPCYAQPPVLGALIAKGALGQKTGAGFFRRDGKAILRLDPATGDYLPADGKAADEVAAILKLPPVARLQGLHESQHPQAKFLWAVLRDFFHYIAVHLADIADTARDVDFAMRWGFGHAVGPFELWQEAGWLQVARWVQDDIAAGKALSNAPLPAWVTSGPVAQAGAVHTSQGSWNPVRGRFEPRSSLPVYQRQIFRAALSGESPAPQTAGRTVFEDAAVRLWTLDRPDLGDVLLASLKTRGGALTEGAAQGLARAVDLAEQGYRGLVLWNPGEQFSSGADPQDSAAGPAIERLLPRLRQALVPTVAAVAGPAVNEGLALAQRCARRVAYLETGMGVTEAGSAGKVSKSAIEARALGYLRESDPILFNVHELLYVAIREAQGLSESGWRAPWPA